MGSEKKMLTGNYATANGVRLARVRVVPIYPITPQTTIVEKLIEFITTKQMDAEFIPVESEHSAMAAAIGAEATGVRAFTASSSQGIAYMHENLWVPSGLRLPLVMAMVNRTMNPPIGVSPDHSDSMAQRDTGWLQIYVENAQESLDMTIQAYKIAEDKSVLLPVAIMYEGGIVSNFLEAVEVPDQESVDDFLPPYRADHIVLDTERPMHLAVSGDDYLPEYRYQQEMAMQSAKEVIPRVGQEFEKKFGRGYGGLVSTFMMEDAEIAFVAVGSICGTVRMTVRELRKEGIKAGLIKLRVFRPFPKEAVEELCKKLELVIVLNRAASSGFGGIVGSELATALYNVSPRPYIVDYILGLAGRPVNMPQLLSETKATIADFRKKQIKQSTKWIGVKGLS